MLSRFPKPKELEGVVTMTPRQKTIRRRQLYLAQHGICGCGCGRRMSLELDRMDTATLEHHTPRSMGCKKNDSPENVYQVWRWDCNSEKSSKRNYVPKVAR